MRVASGFAIGHEAKPTLAAEAVRDAMETADLSIASSVLLFLTAEFARDPMPALRAAAQAANCTQVMGCSAPGIFTEQDWVLDAPAAAVMVFGDGASLQPGAVDGSLLTLAAPNALDTTWMASPHARFGGVSGDAMGLGPFSVWQNASGSFSGYCDAALVGVDGVVAAAHGLRILSLPAKVSAADGHHLLSLNDVPALNALKAVCAEDPLPVHRLMAVYADSADAITRGDYHLTTLVGGEEGRASVILGRQLQVGQWLCWAMRDVDAAQQDLRETAARLRQQLGRAPEFGLLFSCLGRGPYFYGGVDRDLELLKQQFPGLPLIGFYGNGEIAPINGSNELLQYSAVLGLFAAAD